MILIFGTTAMLMFIMSFVLSIGLSMIGEVTWLSGMIIGFIVGGVFNSGSIAIDYLYQQKSLILWIIDASYQTLFLTVTGLILGAWR